MAGQPLILTVDHNQRNLDVLARFLHQAGYRTLAVSTLEQLQQVLQDTDGIHMALVDISGFDRRIWAYCEQLSNKGIPLLVVSPKQVKAIREESLSHGAQEVLFKPLVVKELITVIQSMIRETGDE